MIHRDIASSLPAISQTPSSRTFFPTVENFLMFWSFGKKNKSDIDYSTNMK